MSDDTDIELREVGDWPDAVHMLISGLKDLDDVYALLQVDAPDDMIYHKAMDFLRSARRIRRVEIAAAIISAHSIVLEDDAKDDIPA